MKKRRMTVGVLAITSTIMFAGCAHEQGQAGVDSAGSVRMTSRKEAKQSVEISKLPNHIQKAIEISFPNGKILGVEKEVKGKDVGQYDIDGQVD